jgi:hypothetical protein
VRCLTTAQNVTGLGEDVKTAIASMNKNVMRAAERVSRASGEGEGKGKQIRDKDLPVDSAALAAIERDEDLSADEMDDAYVIVMMFPKIGEVYLAYQKPTTRTNFIMRRIRDFRKQKYNAQGPQGNNE